MKQAIQIKQLRQRRFFSNELISNGLKRKIVIDIEKRKVSVSGVCREYSVSAVSVYKWLRKYSRHLQSGKTLVVQMEKNGPHGKLHGQLSPAQFEKYVSNLAENKRPKMQLYKAS